MAWLALARDTALLGVGAVALGVGSLAIRLDVPWTPPPAAPESTACGIDEPFARDGSDAEPSPSRSIAVAELTQRLANVVIVDARSADAFAGGHIPGAISMPAADIDAIVANQSLPLPVDRDIVTYCDGTAGADAQYVGRVLDAALGCDRVYVLAGGFEAWVSRGEPVEGVLQSG